MPENKKAKAAKKPAAHKAPKKDGDAPSETQTQPQQEVPPVPETKTTEPVPVTQKEVDRSDHPKAPTGPIETKSKD